VAIASRDAAAAGPLAPRLRWLWLSESQPAERKLAWQIVAAHLNGRSRQPVIARPPIVLSTGEHRAPERMPDAEWAKASLVVCNLDDYGISASAWDGLGHQDPYFHATVVEHWPGGNDRNGRYWAAGNYTVLAAAPWIAETAEAKAAIKSLLELTQCRTPVLRADNFIWQTAIQADRQVGYYGLLGVTKRDDYLRLIGLDLKSSQAFTPEALAVIANSGVARQPRRLARYAALGGGAWATFDNELATNEFNPLRFLNGTFKHKAEEWFGLLPNGMWAVGLFAADGTRQDSAPDFVGFDRFAHSNDGRIHVGLSCFRCHATAGLQDFKDSVKNLYAFPQVLQSPSSAKAIEVQQKYFQAITGKIKRDRETYAEALAEACGMTPPDYAKALSAYFARYDAPVTAEQAAAELGVPLETMLARFDAMRKSPAGLDNSLGFFTVEGAKREPLPRFQWIEIYPVGQLALRGLVQWPK
jgi:hypothetical protein